MFRDLFLRHIPENEVDHFGVWAFGEDCESLKNGPDFLNRWNALHGKQLTLFLGSKPLDDSKKMVELYKNRSAFV